MTGEISKSKSASVPRGDIPITITALNENGDGTGFIENLKITVEKTLPGEEVRVSYLPDRGRKDRIRLERIITKSPQRIDPPCPYFASCGGCHLQHMTYSAQLQWKQQILQQQLQKFELIASLAVRPVAAMPGVIHYRNKAQMPFQRKGSEIIYGLFQQGTHQITAIDHCLVENRDANQALNLVRDWAQRFQIEPYDEKNGSGVLRHVVIRRGQFTHQLMVVLVCRKENLPHWKELIRILQARLPSLRSVILNINEQVTNVILGKKNLCLWGEQYIEEQLGRIKFRIYPSTFFQANSVQMLRLVEKVISLLDLQKTDRVLDLFCGIGTIGLILAGRAAEVMGVDNNPDSIRCARENAEMNFIGNVHFDSMDLLKGINGKAVTDFRPDIIIADPPRKGLSEILIRQIVALRPRKIAYISCNPQTFIPELALLTQNGYQATEIYPFDMFPHTAHVECLTILQRGPETL